MVETVRDPFNVAQSQSTGCLDAQTITDIYVESFKNESFLILFALFLLMNYSFDTWAQNTTKYFSFLSENRRSYFAETLLSFIHAIITSMTCCAQLMFNTPWTRRIYSYSANVSCAYFVVHGFGYLSLKGTTNRVLVLHHVLNFLAVVPITNADAFYLQDSQCSDVVYFVSAGLHAVEISTIWLDIRIFFKLWHKQKCFFASTVGLVATYFPLRCVWLGYVTYVLLQSHGIFDACFCYGAMFIVMSTFSFIWLMSAAYSLTMLQSGSKLFHIQHYKDC